MAFSVCAASERPPGHQWPELWVQHPACSCPSPGSGASCLAPRFPWPDLQNGDSDSGSPGCCELTQEMGLPAIFLLFLVLYKQENRCVPSSLSLSSIYFFGICDEPEQHSSKPNETALGSRPCFSVAPGDFAGQVSSCTTRLSPTRCLQKTG